MISFIKKVSHKKVNKSIIYFFYLHLYSNIPVYKFQNYFPVILWQSPFVLISLSAPSSPSEGRRRATDQGKGYLWLLQPIILSRAQYIKKHLVFCYYRPKELYHFVISVHNQAQIVVKNLSRVEFCYFKYFRPNHLENEIPSADHWILDQKDAERKTKFNEQNGPQDKEAHSQEEKESEDPELYEESYWRHREEGLFPVSKFFRCVFCLTLMVFNSIITWNKYLSKSPILYRDITCFINSSFDELSFSAHYICPSLARGILLDPLPTPQMNIDMTLLYLHTMYYIKPEA